jgi:hypothetical protein
MIEPIVGRNSGDAAPPLYPAICLATFGWSLTRQGRSPAPAVAPDFFAGGPCGFVDGFEERVRVDEVFARIGGTASDLRVVHAISARWNEEIGDSDPEGVGDSLDDVNFDVANATLDSGDSWSRDLGFLGELLLRKLGSGPPDDEIDT